MIDHSEPLAVLLALVDGIPLPPPAPRRGRPDVYADHLILKGLVVLLVRRVWQAHGVLAILSELTAQMARIQAQLTDQYGRFPSRRTWERRLARLAAVLPLLIALLGTWLLRRLTPLATWRSGRGDRLHLSPGTWWGLAQEASGGR